MRGVSWDDREPTDWLASNGRWYPERDYPRGWSTSALPPAPGQGGVASILGDFTGTESPDLASSPSAVAANANAAAGGWTVGSDGTPSPSAEPTANAVVVPTRRRVADATLSETSPRPAAEPREFPPPPGRLGAAPAGSPPMPAPPENPTPASAPATVPAERTTHSGPAGDLGKVLGTAKRRIEKAINDAAEL